MVIDRINDMFQWKGFHINPSDIEDCIQSLDGVKLVSVVGFSDPEINRTTAAVVKKVGFEKLTEKQIIEHVAKNLPLHKQLHGGVVFMDSLPMTVTGKILKRVIRDRLSK
jgi:4-coumarate--CoA ligase